MMDFHDEPGTRSRTFLFYFLYIFIFARDFGPLPKNNGPNPRSF